MLNVEELSTLDRKAGQIRARDEFIHDILEVVRFKLTQLYVHILEIREIVDELVERLQSIFQGGSELSAVQWCNAVERRRHVMVNLACPDEFQVARLHGKARKFLNHTCIVYVDSVHESVDCGSLVVLGFELAAKQTFFWNGGTVVENDMDNSPL